MQKNKKIILFVIAVTIVVIAVILSLPNLHERSYSSSMFGFNSESQLSRGLFKQDNKAPVISFKSPVNNFCRLKSICQFVEGQAVTISVDVTDDIAVKNVAIYIDDVIQKNFMQSPYEFIWNSRLVTNGPHTVKVVAVDATNNKTTLITNLEVRN